jgi:hypothetical protein
MSLCPLVSSPQLRNRFKQDVALGGYNGIYWTNLILFSVLLIQTLLRFKSKLYTRISLVAIVKRLLSVKREDVMKYAYSVEIFFLLR